MLKINDRVILLLFIVSLSFRFSGDAVAIDDIDAAGILRQCAENLKVTDRVQHEIKTRRMTFSKGLLLILTMLNQALFTCGTAKRQLLLIQCWKVPL